MTVTATKIDSSHESGKNFITWAWPAWSTIIYNNQRPAEKGFRLPPLWCSGLVALSSPNELFACQLRIRKLYLGRVKPIFDFVNTELNNVSCL
jgi:hypothetical protein